MSETICPFCGQFDWHFMSTSQIFRHALDCSKQFIEKEVNDQMNKLKANSASQAIRRNSDQVDELEKELAYQKKRYDELKELFDCRALIIQGYQDLLKHYKPIDK